MYHQAAVHFVELHETPERMLEKNAIHEIVPWRTARRQMFWRVRRRLLEGEVQDEILSTQPADTDTRQIDAMMRRWFVEDKGATSSYLWDQDEVAASWIEAQRKSEYSVLSRNMSCVRHDAVVTNIKLALDSCPNVKLDVILELANRLHANERAELLRTLSQLESPQESRPDSST